MMIVYYGFILLVAFNNVLSSPRSAWAKASHDGHPDRFRRHRLHDPDHRLLRQSRERRVRHAHRRHRRGGGANEPSGLSTIAGAVSRSPAVRRLGCGLCRCSSSFTLFITKWAAASTKSAADFYTGGGGITGFQNGLAIAGDYMSAASFLGISAAVMAERLDGLIYSIGFLVGWPVITFLMAERLRNLGKFTFADVAAYRFSRPRSASSRPPARWWWSPST